jgi:dihydrofolate synthase/folylpolyglutamate synthase
MSSVTRYTSYEAVCDELDLRHRIALGFERIEALLKLLGDPHRSLRIVQVVGTNGKGTTAVALANALEAADQPSGAYLSPHVLSYTERAMLRGSFVSKEEFAAAMEKTIEVADANDIPATQFELLTAGTLTMFHEAGLEWAVLEAGLGARHDATSAAKPEMVVLTNVGLDHTEYLGDTVEKIAEEKLASLRSGAALVLGTDAPQIVEVARREAARVGAHVVEHEEAGKQSVDVPYLVRNERLGVRAAEVLLGRPLRQEELKVALRVRLPARFEVHEIGEVPVVVDGGHNPEGLKAALEAVRRRYGERLLGIVFGVLKDKDAGSMLSALESEAAILVLTLPTNAGERALDPWWLEKEYEPRDTRGRKAQVTSDACDALRLAVEEMEKAGGVVLVTGSLCTGAGVLRWLGSGRY